MIFTEVIAPLLAALITVPLLFKSIQDPAGWVTRALWFLVGAFCNMALLAIMTGFNAMYSAGVLVAWVLLYWPLYKMHGTPIGQVDSKEEE